MFTNGKSQYVANDMSGEHQSRHQPEFGSPAANPGIVTSAAVNGVDGAMNAGGLGNAPVCQAGSFSAMWIFTFLRST
jgi:hypothetical protein